MGVDIYGNPGSPPCRAVFLSARALGVDYNIKPVNPMAGEHRTPEFLKMNPGHTIPTMDDDGLYLGESRAISTYLADRYAPDNNLYPREPEARAMVDQRLYFDAGLFAALKGILGPLFRQDLAAYDANLPRMEECMDLLEEFLKRSPYVAGQEMTLADLAILANVTTMEAADIDLARWPRVLKWLAKLKKLPYYEVNVAGAKHMGDVIKKMMFSAKKAKFSA